MRLVREIKDIHKYINNISEQSRFSIDNITVEHRNNNVKRDFLFVNKKQCKHIPCKPSEMVKMCNMLADTVSKGIKPNEKVLIVGFAETATAIANFVADRLPQCKYVIQTTREEIQDSQELITFKEEHSHATTQKLLTYSDDEQININDFTYILFVEDEISTGNTILNFIEAFKKIDKEDGKVDIIKFGVASICNWQNKEHRTRFIDRDIDTFALLLGELKSEHVKMLLNNEKNSLITSETKAELESKHNIKDSYKVITVSNSKDKSKSKSKSCFITDRLGHKPNRDMQSVYTNVHNELMSKHVKIESVRVVGTEEFMYIPIKIAEYIENLGIYTLCHANTRSPIDVIDTEAFGTTDSIKESHKTISFYSKDRKTYIYNLNEITDLCILVTDGSLEKQEEEKLISLYAKYANAVLIVYVQ